MPCLTPPSPRSLEAADLTLGLGEYDLSQPDPDRVQLFDVEDILVNERFNSDAYTDDIAILYLAGEVVFGDYVWPICLPPPDMDLTGQLAVVIGEASGRLGHVTDEGGRTRDVD